MPLRRCSGWTRRRRLTLRKWTKPPKIPADSISIVPMFQTRSRWPKPLFRYLSWDTWDDNAGWLRSWNSPETYAGCWDSGAVRNLPILKNFLNSTASSFDPVSGRETMKLWLKCNTCCVKRCVLGERFALVFVAELFKQWKFPSCQFHPCLHHFQVCAVGAKKL